MISSAPPASPKSSRFFLIFKLKKWNFMFLACHLTYFLACHLTSYFLKPYELPHEVTLRDISYACCAGLLKYS